MALPTLWIKGSKLFTF